MHMIETKEAPQSTIPLRYRGLTFDNFEIDRHKDQKKCRDIVKGYVSTFDQRAKEWNSMIFIGHSGTGKTLLARIMQQSLLRLNHSVCYETISNLLLQLKHNDYRSAFNLRTVYEDYLQYSLLIIDDVTEGIGFSNLSKDEKYRLYSLIDIRYQNYLPLALISNHNTDELIKKLGKPIINRLLSKGIVLAFNCEPYL